MATLAEALKGLNYTGMDTGYGIAATTLGQMTPQLINPYGSTGQAIGISLGSVLLQSLLGYQARQQSARDTLELNTLANQMQTLATPQERTDFISGVSDPMNQSRLSTLSTALMGQETERKAKAAEKLLGLETAADFELGPKGTELFKRKQQADLDLANARLRRLEPTPTPAVEVPEPGIIKGRFGEYEPLPAKRDRLIKEAERLGLPPSARLNYADKNLKAEESTIKTAMSKVDKIRESINNSDYLIARVTQGKEKAGQTGGPAWQAAIREAASGLYSTIPTEGGREERAQRAATKELDSIRPEIVKELRSPGSVSNYETEMLIGAGPSSANTPEENTRILANMVRIRDLNEDYANFMEAYIEDKGSAFGADQVWHQYKKDQVFIDNKFNDNRMPWNEWFQTKMGGSETANVTLDAKMQRLQQLEQQARQLGIEF
jgi:hypothetical protein